jgi:restriction endonuclease S subunit
LNKFESYYKVETQLKEIADLQFGYYVQPHDKGEIMYLQAKNFDEYGNLRLEIDTWLNFKSTPDNHLLKDGDILFVGKGMRNFAWAYSQSLGKAVASSIFFVIRPNKDKVVPEYLTTLFNMPKYQAYFHAIGAGSSIPSIRKNELEVLLVPLPQLSTQRHIVEISKLHKRSLDITGQILAEKNKLFQAVINNIIYK